MTTDCPADKPGAILPRKQRRSSSRLLSIATIGGLSIGITVMVGILAVHVGLLTKAEWGGDEYRTIGHYGDLGVAYLLRRFWTWSPRPLSESLIWLYAALVIALRRPLIIPALSVCWLLCSAACLPALLRCPWDRLLPRLLGVTAILAALVLSDNVTRVLYWPFGAAAYAPVIAAVLFILFLLANERNEPRCGGPVVAMVLVLAAWSAEIGALFVLIYAPLMVLFLRWTGGPESSLRSVRNRWGPPVLAALSVILLLAHNERADDPMLAFGDPSRYHHFFASLKAALLRLGPEFIAIDGETFDRPSLIQGAAVKLLLFAGLHACWLPPGQTARRTQPWLLIFALSLMLTTLAMLTASYRQFGQACCEQHAFLRQCFGLIALAAVAIGIPPATTMIRRWLFLMAPAALVTAVALLFGLRMAEVTSAYRHYGESARARAMTRASGFAAGQAMIFYQPVPARMFPPMIPAGLQVATDNWWSEGILTYFHKKSVLVLIAETHDRP